MEQTTLVQTIQNTLAPAVMISSSALFLLGFQNKFSALFNRFRSLNEEKRRLKSKTNRDSIEHVRLTSLESQLARLMRRATYVKNAIQFTYLAIICFLVTSFFLFWNSYGERDFKGITLAFFGMGLVLILATSISVMIEVTIAYNVLKLERKS